jgi:hypothetical protein
MKLNASILAAALAGVSFGAACAQGAPPPPQDAREGLQKACVVELTGVCAGKSGRDAAECLRAAGDKVSAGCKEAMSKMVRPGAGAGAGAGAGDARPAAGAADARPRGQGAPPPPAGTPVAPGSTWTLDVREDWLIGRVHRAQEDHEIDGAEADRVYKEVASMRDRAKQISIRRARALTAGEMSAQLGRVDALAASIHWLTPNVYQRPW